jgi:diguanylate cyclase (GGDEF)-like protein
MSNTIPPQSDKQHRASSLLAWLRIGTIRGRLLIAFLLLVLLPAIIISTSSVILDFQRGQEQVIDQLESVATLKEKQIAAWLESLQIQLNSVLYPHRAQSLLEPLSDDQVGTPVYQAAVTELQFQFDQMCTATGLFEEVMLLNLQGRVLVSSRSAGIGQVHAMQDFFLLGLHAPYTQSLSSDISQGRRSPVWVSRPVRDLDGEVHGVLAAQASPDKLNEIMLQQAGLGATGETYLVGENFMLLTDSRFGNQQEKVLRLQTPTLEHVFQEHRNQAGLYRNYREHLVIGVYHWLPDLQMVLVAEQGQAEAFQELYETLMINLIIAAIAVLAALISAMIMAHGIAAPLAKLADTAGRIAAGDLQLRARVERADEIGALAAAFNSMTARLRQVIGNLEQHVDHLQRAESEVRRVNAYLAHDIAEQQTLSRLSNRLQHSQSLSEAFTASLSILQELFGNSSGALYRFDQAGSVLELVGRWGSQAPGESQPPNVNCPALQPGERFALSDPAQPAGYCRTCTSYEARPLMCAQLQAGNEQFGLLHIRLNDPDSESAHNSKLPLLTRSTDLMALALSNIQLRENLREQAIRDPLTGLFNRRFLNETLSQKLSAACRHQRTVGIFLLDMDHFKHINDTYGHDAGDAVLREVGALLRRGLRTEDIACRFGGEELLLVLPEITEAAAIKRANELRREISNLHIVSAHHTLPTLTASIGLAIFPYHGNTVDSIITAADHALYEAKAGGRDQVCVAELARETTF